jgi:azurin
LEWRSRADFAPQKTHEKLDLHQGADFGGSLISGQMKAKLTTRTAQHFARLAEPVIRGSSQVGPERKTTMKRTTTQLFPVIALGCSALLYSLTGCSKAPEGPSVTVSVSCDDKMKYDVTAFEAKPGQKVVVTVTNKGTTPKFSMGHNFVLLDRTINMGNVQSWLDKASTEAAHDYVPPDSKEVLAHSKLLGPGESDTVAFNAPYIPGEYVYTCSFPGHSTQGMRGTLTVRQ